MTPPTAAVPTRRSIRLRAAASVVVLGGLAACGGSDDDGATSSDSVPDTSAGTDAPAATEPAEPSAQSETSEPTEGAALLTASRSCLDDLGIDVAAGTEAETGLSADMMDGLGVEEILVFGGPTDGGTIEAFATSEQADVAQTGYADSPFGYQVMRIGDVVVKTVGSADSLNGIAVCLGDETAVPELTEEQAAPATESAPVETEPAPVDTEPAPPASIVTPSDLDEDRAAIFEMFTATRFVEQDVVFVPECLDGWVRSLSDADAAVIADPDGDESALSPDAEIRGNELYGCLDVGYLADLYVENFDADPTCVSDAFDAIDLVTVAAEQGQSIDIVFEVLADAAFECT